MVSRAYNILIFYIFVQGIFNDTENRNPMIINCLIPEVQAVECFGNNRKQRMLSVSFGYIRKSILVSSNSFRSYIRSEDLNCPSTQVNTTAILTTFVIVYRGCQCTYKMAAEIIVAKITVLTHN